MSSNGQVTTDAFNEAAFAEHFTQAQLVVLQDLGALPVRAITALEGCSRRFIHPDNYRPGNFDALWQIGHDDGSMTYVASQIKESSPGHIERETYLFDFADGEEVGHSEIRKVVASGTPLTRAPFVGYTYTEEAYAQQGLGRRRLDVMNALSHVAHGMPLHSGQSPEPYALRIWERLAGEGLAHQEVDEVGVTRWVHDG